jgi:hypothetical protein
MQARSVNLWEGGVRRVAGSARPGDGTRGDAAEALASEHSRHPYRGLRAQRALAHDLSKTVAFCFVEVELL